jgi:hypothetical protein
LNERAEPNWVARTPAGHDKRVWGEKQKAPADFREGFGRDVIRELA